MTAKRTTLELVNDIDRLTEELKGDLSAAEHTLRRKRRTAAQRELDRRLAESAQQDRINDLNGEIERLKGSVREWRARHDKAVAERDSLKKRHYDLRGERDRLFEDRNAQRRRFSASDALLQKAYAEIKELEARPSGESDRIRALEMKLEAKAAANKALKKERADLLDRDRAWKDGYNEQSLRLSEEGRLFRAQAAKLSFWRQMFVILSFVAVGLAAYSLDVALGLVTTP